ncbi:MAG TPA: flagellar motor switch protein FliM [Bryobacteraceae bacterium]|nr:flagellar motor switch protein FliM [Bryobacteraceae bacterium]
MSDSTLSQGEIGRNHRNQRERRGENDRPSTIEPYDFRRPDRIAKEQLRSIHLLHETFARAVASSLSAFLRSYVFVNLASVEQLSFAEFVKSLPSPSCMVSLGLRPYEGNAVLELGHSLVFPIFEMLLGGTGKNSANIHREITEIEKSILDSVFRVILQELKSAWQAVTFMDFIIESHETEPQLLQMLAPNEAVVAVGLEMQIGENRGVMNIGIPSIIVKMLRQKFDQQWTVRKGQSTDSEHARIFKLLKPACLQADVRLTGPTVRLDDLLRIDVGDVLTFDHSTAKELKLQLNGKTKFLGHVVANGGKREFQIGAESRSAE